ncbi:unnamed protein product [Laminaria digitata]
MRERGSCLLPREMGRRATKLAERSGCLLRPWACERGAGGGGCCPYQSGLGVVVLVTIIKELLGHRWQQARFLLLRSLSSPISLPVFFLSFFFFFFLFIIGLMVRYVFRNPAC